MEINVILLILSRMFDACLALYEKTSNQSTKDWCEGKLSAYRDCFDVIKSSEFLIR